MKTSETFCISCLYPAEQQASRHSERSPFYLSCVFSTAQRCSEIPFLNNDDVTKCVHACTEVLWSAISHQRIIKSSNQGHQSS